MIADFQINFQTVGKLCPKCGLDSYGASCSISFNSENPTIIIHDPGNNYCPRCEESPFYPPEVLLRILKERIKYLYDHMDNITIKQEPKPDWRI